MCTTAIVRLTLHQEECLRSYQMSLHVIKHCDSKALTESVSTLPSGAYKAATINWLEIQNDQAKYTLTVHGTKLALRQLVSHSETLRRNAPPSHPC